MSQFDNFEPDWQTEQAYKDEKNNTVFTLKDSSGKFFTGHGFVYGFSSAQWYKTEDTAWQAYVDSLKETLKMAQVADTVKIPKKKDLVGFKVIKQDLRDVPSRSSYNVSNRKEGMRIHYLDFFN